MRRQDTGAELDSDGRSETLSCGYAQCDGGIIVTWWEFDGSEGFMGGCDHGHIQVIQAGSWRGPTLCAYCGDAEAIAGESDWDPYCSALHRDEDRAMHLVRTLYRLLDDRPVPRLLTEDPDRMSEAELEELVAEVGQLMDTPPTARNPEMMAHLVHETLKEWVPHPRR